MPEARSVWSSSFRVAFAFVASLKILVSNHLLEIPINLHYAASGKGIHHKIEGIFSHSFGLGIWLSVSVPVIASSGNRNTRSNSTVENQVDSS
jgi:hypothetical protein